MQVKSHPNRVFLVAFFLLALPVMFLWRVFLPGSRLFAWAIGANAAAFAVWAYDKHQAQKGGWRVPERVLHIMAFLGASPASLLAMSFLRHKTTKRSFVTLYSVLLVLHIAIGLWILFPPQG